MQRAQLAAAVGDARLTAAGVEAADGAVAALRTAIAGAEAARTTAAAAGQRVLAERCAQRLRHQLAAALAAAHRAREAHAGRVAATDAARDQLAVARAEREVIERHFARWREAQARAAERREE